MTPRPVMPGAVAHRQAEIEVSLRLSRYHNAYRKRLLGAIEERLPLPNDPSMTDIARCAALSELHALAARGVLVLGPDEGPRPIKTKVQPVPVPRRAPARGSAFLVSFGDEEPKPWGKP